MFEDAQRSLVTTVHALKPFMLRSEYQPRRSNVPEPYVRKHAGKPFNSPQRPASYNPRTGAYAYHAPPKEDEVLIELTSDDEYIGILGRYDPDHATRRGIREMKWIQPGASTPIPPHEASRDLTMHRRPVLDQAYACLDGIERGNDERRAIARATRSVLTDYLAHFGKLRFIHDTVEAPDSEADKAVHDAVKRNVAAGRKYWSPSH